MKRIQISTVKKEALVEVIDLNSAFVANTVKAAFIARSLKRHIEACLPLKAVTDDNGNMTKEPDWDCSCHMTFEEDELKDITQMLCGFVEELEAALLGEEDER